MVAFDLTERFARILYWEEGMTFEPWMWWGLGIFAIFWIWVTWNDSESDDLQKDDEDESRSNPWEEFEDSQKLMREQEDIQKLIKEFEDSERDKKEQP